MRKTLRGFCAIAVLTLLTACGIFFYAAWNQPVFDRGQSYTFYFEKNSSCRAVVSDEPALCKLLLGKVSGESVQYDGDRVRELFERFSAELIFTESACGVENYYCRSPLLQESVCLNGYPVNLHIAFSKGRTAVGTPLIFGGF